MVSFWATEWGKEIGKTSGNFSASEDDFSIMLWSRWRSAVFFPWFKRSTGHAWRWASVREIQKCNCISILGDFPCLYAQSVEANIICHCVNLSRRDAKKGHHGSMHFGQNSSVETKQRSLACFEHFLKRWLGPSSWWLHRPKFIHPLNWNVNDCLFPAASFHIGLALKIAPKGSKWVTARESGSTKSLKNLGNAESVSAARRQFIYLLHPFWIPLLEFLLAQLQRDDP